MSMFDQIINLPVGINYELTATWSRSSHSKTDDLQTQKYLGYYIMNEKRKQSRFSEGGCILYGDYLQFISNVNASEFANDAEIKNGSSYIEINQNKEANFVLQTFLLTTESCQLQDVVYKSLKPFVEPLIVYNLDGDLEMNLTVSIVSEKDFDLNEAYLIYSIFQSCTNRLNSNEVCAPVPSYSVSNETQCPKIGVKYSELSAYLTDSNYTIIASMFPGNKTEIDEVVYTCLDDYYRWLDSAGVRPPLVNSHPNSGDDILPSRLPMFISICFTLDLII